ncbi:MAG: DUF4917 family protein [Ectothiorhodospiraceae bacterium AqS1]|nr:DUF4917 family protein [Ectothiorhodospiraceae bacterium AqS1]
MPEIIKFEEAIEEAKEIDDGKLTLLIGNGFSAHYFNYSSLLEASGLADEMPERRLFDALNTVDFEEVFRVLGNAIQVAEIYPRDDYAERLKNSDKKIRESLMQAIQKTHPESRTEIEDKLSTVASFLSLFSTLFTLNYDLLLYWAVLENKYSHRDGFQSGHRSDYYIGPFSEYAYCDMYNLHGGLHLFRDENGGTHKAIGRRMFSRMLDLIKNNIRNGFLPIYVAEGLSAQKMEKIKSIRYLEHCYEKLKESTGVIFIYGHSASENDSHIYDAIFKSKVSQIYFGFYDKKEIKNLDGRLAKYQKEAGSEIPYKFFDSKIIELWEN